MKVLSARAVRDGEDLQVLLRHLGITSRAEVWAIVGRFFPGVEIPSRSTELVDDLLA
jgi:hypothetical protein